MVKSKPFSFIWARDVNELQGGQRTLYRIWNTAALLASSALIAAMSLLLAYGLDSQLYGNIMFYNYFQHPSLFLLNWLPVLLLLLLTYSLFGRQWAAYLVTAVLVIGASVAHYYKLKIRYEPLLFADLKLAGAALGVISNYSLRPGTRLILAVLSVPLGAAVLALLVHGRPKAKLRLGLALAVLLAVFPLWRFVYSSDRIYEDSSVMPVGTLTGWKQQYSASKGFLYPFIYSIKFAVPSPPEGYSDAKAEELLSGYEDAPIPQDRRVDLLVFQLEAFCDLTRSGISGITPETYEIYHRLEAESYVGNMISNRNGGNTIDPERCFLSGSYHMCDYGSSSYSHVWYLRSQGYATTGNHPYFAAYFSRGNVNANLGFEEYRFEDDWYEQFPEILEGWLPNRIFIPDVLDHFESCAEQERPVFSFNVTVQGHSPYSTDHYEYEPVYWPGDGYSEQTRCILNNYLGSAYDTQVELAAALDRLREAKEPVVVLVYGDHKPWLGNDASALMELEVNNDLSTEEGFVNYYSTRYLIWANDAAKEQLGDDFVGEGPDVSSGFLMNLLFEKLGWKGSAFIQFGDKIRQTLPVVTANGYYYEDGHLTDSLSPKGQEAFRDLDYVTYYVNHNYAHPLENGADGRS